MAVQCKDQGVSIRGETTCSLQHTGSISAAVVSEPCPVAFLCSLPANQGWGKGGRWCTDVVAAQKSRYVTGSRASFRDVGFVTKPFCLRQAVSDQPLRQASATNLCDKPLLGTAWVSYLFFKTARSSRDKPRDIRMKRVGATYVCNTGGWRDTATYPYLEPQPCEGCSFWRVLVRYLGGRLGKMSVVHTSRASASSRKGERKLCASYLLAMFIQNFKLTLHIY